MAFPMHIDTMAFTAHYTIVFNFFNFLNSFNSLFYRPLIRYVIKSYGIPLI